MTRFYMLPSLILPKPWLVLRTLQFSMKFKAMALAVPCLKYRPKVFGEGGDFRENESAGTELQ